MKRRHLRLQRGGGTRCNHCDRVVPASHPVLLVSDPAKDEIVGFFHRFCYAGAERLGLQRPGELDLTVVFLDDAERN